MSIVLQFSYEELPPTSNHIYIRGTMLTQKARDYAESFAMATRRYLHITSSSAINIHAIYGLHLRFFFYELVNRTYNDPKTPPSKRAKTRYKKIDLSNRIKLLEDCVRDLLMVDDSQTFAASQEKHQCGPGEKEHVEIVVQRLDTSHFGL